MTDSWNVSIVVRIFQKTILRFETSIGHVPPNNEMDGNTIVYWKCATGTPAYRIQMNISVTIEQHGALQLFRAEITISSMHGVK